MSNDLCSPFNCNICLMSHENSELQNFPPTPDLQQLLTCSGCQMIKYCNRQHQKVDWPLHQEFCRAVQKIKQNLNVSHPFYINGGVPKSREELEKIIVQLKYLLRNALGRPLEYQEEELSSFPAFCGQCLKFKNLKVICKKCGSQLYCSELHKDLHEQEHAKICGLLKMYYCPYKVQPITEDLELQCNINIKDLKKKDLVECFQRAFSLKLPLDPCDSLKSYQLFSGAADFSCIMSICYALQHLYVLDSKINKFEIFILGASVEAVLWFREIHCKFFFLQYPQIKELTLDFIGPEVVEPNYKELTFNYLNSERLIKFHTYQGLFQDYCKYYHVKPSLMVAFNCGFSEFSQCHSKKPALTNLNTLDPLVTSSEINNSKDTWFEGLVEILQTFDTPIVFTSFTEQESQFDFATLQNAAVKQKLKVHIEPILKVDKNPFHDLRPLRQWYTRDKEEFYYRNGYIQAIRTKLEK